MAETRTCEQCGAVFAPRREHARFCGARCRARWNREHTGDPAARACALQWSVTAMTETIERLPSVRAWDRTRAFAAIGEAVWQVTLVDATLAPRGRAWELARYRAYQAHLAGQPVGQTLGRTAAFLNLAAADARSVTVTGAHAGR